MCKHTPLGCVVLVVYVDDIILTGSDEVEFAATKAYLYQHFVTHDLSPPRCILGIEIAYRLNQMVLCQRKYTLNPLEETSTRYILKEFIVSLPISSGLLRRASYTSDMDIYMLKHTMMSVM